MTPTEHPLSDALGVSTAEPDRPANTVPGAVAAHGSPPTRAIAWLALATLLALLVSLVVYLAISVPNDWFPAAPPNAFAANGLALTHGTGQLVGDELRVTAADSTGLTVISLLPDLKSSDYAAIAWIAADIPERATVSLLWRTDYAPEKLNTLDVPVESGRTRPVMVANNAAWIGRITGLALAIQGPLSQPIRIRGVVAKPLGALEILGDRAQEWLAFEGWTGASINTITGGADFQDLPLPVLLAVAMALVGVGVMLITRRYPGAFGASMPTVLAGLFLASWLVLDARWTGNLIRQEGQTAQQYAGKSLREKHLAGEDAPLFAFIERARQVLPTQPARIFVAADASYFRGRAAYHLYPHRVFFDPASNELQWVDQMRPGDWLVVYQQRGIQYDAKRQMLRWRTGRTTSAELKLVGPGAALFQVQ